MSDNDSQPQPYVPEGMPPLDLSGRNVSYFEFWPMWLIYLPVVLQWIGLSLRHRSLTLPLIANPAIPLAGMVGVAKSAVFEAAGPQARQWILPWLLHRVTGEPASTQAEAVLRRLQAVDLALPVVAKPNIGCRGAGVKLLRSQAALEDTIRAYPEGAEIQLQQLSDWEAEAGVFYVREPGQAQGRVTSLTLKYTPYVVGDGVRRLGELVAADPRAGALIHLYRRRLAEQWDQVVPAGQPYRLIFSASHSRGAVFRSAPELITEALTRRLDQIFDDIPGFHYGRLDLKFRNSDALRAGRDFVIIEINGASSESIHIWDRHSRLGPTVKTLLQQYSTLFKLGLANRARGYRPPGIAELWRAWRHETKLIKQYPHND